MPSKRARSETVETSNKLVKRKMSKKLTRENTAPKMKGAGDGIRASLIKSADRVPVPSSRKFTATGARDDAIQLKLKKVIEDIESKQKRLQKAQSVAEITPTKSKRKNRTDDAASSTTMLHATPRLRPPSRRRDEERRLERLGYGRVLLFVWRRNRTRLATLSESLRRQQDQTASLEKQVECLKELTQSECNKRNEAIGEVQRMENLIKSVKSENETLLSEKLHLQLEIDNLRSSLNSFCVELENARNDINTKNACLKRLEQEMQKERSLLKHIKEEKIIAINEMRALDAESKGLKAANRKLHQELEDSDRKLEEREAQIARLEQAIGQYVLESKRNESVKRELMDQRSINEELRRNLSDVERELASVNEHYVRMINENARLKMELERQWIWWKNAKKFVSVTWIVLQNAAYIMLPAM